MAKRKAKSEDILTKVKMVVKERGVEFASTNRADALAVWVTKILKSILGANASGAVATDESRITDFCDEAWVREKDRISKEQRDIAISKFCEELSIKLGVQVTSGDTVVGVAKRLRDKDLNQPN